MLLYTRAEDMTDFDPKTKHSQEELDALRAKYPSRKDMTLSTVLFSGDEPVQLLLGVHDCRDHTKNEFYHEVDLTAPILPVAADLIPDLHQGLKALRRKIQATGFLFHNGKGEPCGRNWPNDVVKKFTGHACGVLRKSVEQESYKLHTENPQTFTRVAVFTRRTRLPTVSSF